MAEPIITIKNMPDSGTHARVALELARHCIEKEGPGALKDGGSILNLYADCLRAAQGIRPDS